MCLDFSATPFYIQGSGYVEGSPFPWIVSDFGLVDAIECGITKIPQVPVDSDSGRPTPEYFELWKWINEKLIRSINFDNGQQPKPVLDDMPQHEFKPEALSDSFMRMLPDLILMIFLIILFFVGAYVSFIRYDVR